MKLPNVAMALALLFEAAHAQTSAPAPSSELLRGSDSAADAFAAIGFFRGPLNCTGSLVDPSGAGAASAKAWLLTAGHCISLDAYGVIRDQPLSATVQFRFFVDTPPSNRVTVRTRAV